MELLEIDEIQARAILDMQLRKLAALERQKIIDEYDELEREIADYKDILASESASGRSWRRARRDRRQVRRRAAQPDRRPSTATCRWRTSSPRRTSSSRSPAAATPSAPGSDLYRVAARGGKGVRGAALRGTTSSSTSSSPRRTTGCCSSPTWGGSTAPRPTSCPRPGATPRAARGQPAGLPARREDRPGARLRDYEQAPYLVLATRNGLVKKTRLTDYDSPAPAASSRSTCARTTTS
jgi:DNA gyrase subunit A